MDIANPKPRNRRIVGDERATLTKDFLLRYSNGDSIDTIARATRRSYGFVHRILTEGGATLRGRGGARTRRTR